MLAGDNSILQKATDAKEYSERAEIVENAKIDVLSEITKNKGTDLQESQLKSVLEKYFINSGIPEELPSDLSTLELTTMNGKYKVLASEVYNGNLLKSPTSAKLTDIVKNTDYGKSIDYSVTVNGTTLNNWKVFLNDGNNIYVILADNLASDLMPDLGFPIENNGGWYGLGYESDGSPEDITDKLIDTNSFTDFASGIGALSATGAPTLEQFEASYGQTIKEGDIIQGAMYNTR